MEVNLPSYLPLVRGGGDRQRVAFTAWVHSWQGSSWSSWAQISWIYGTISSSDQFGAYTGNTSFISQGQPITTWYSSYVPAGFYQWYVGVYYYANQSFSGGYPEHNNPNGETNWCDFVT